MFSLPVGRLVRVENPRTVAQTGCGNHDLPLFAFADRRTRRLPDPLARNTNYNAQHLGKLSNVQTSNGDDYPEAAHKLLLDAQTLVGQQRADGAAYLSGYVVECALKSLWQLETGKPRRGHDLRKLAQAVGAVATVAGVKTARYYKQATSSVTSAGIAAWRPEMRYWSPTMSGGEAQAWCNIAEAVFHETVAQMRLDGEL